MRRLFVVPAILALFALAAPASAQKAGGTLRVSHRDNPPKVRYSWEGEVAADEDEHEAFPGQYQELPGEYREVKAVGNVAELMSRSGREQTVRYEAIS